MVYFKKVGVLVLAIHKFLATCRHVGHLVNVLVIESCVILVLVK